MRLHHFELGGDPQKTIEDLTLFRNDRCLVELSKRTLALPLTFDEKLQGYVFHGIGKLVVDSIVETTRGAVGRPTVKTLDRPFLMLGRAEDLRESLEPADALDLREVGYESTTEFIEEASEFCEDLLKERHTNGDFDRQSSHLFVFKSEKGDSDVLVAKKKGFVFKSGRKIYVSKGSKSVLQCPGEIVVSKKGKTVVIANNNILVERHAPMKED